MPLVLIYLLQANTALLLFFLAYYLVLRRLTFYGLNRLSLLFGMVFSVIYPVIDFPDLSSSKPVLVSSIQRMVSWTVLETIPQQTADGSQWTWLVVVFWSGVGVMAVRLAVQLLSLHRIHRSAQPTTYKGFRFRAVHENFNPFSFGQTIYLNPSRHSEEELAPILQHERVHVREWHTLDVLLAELSTIFFWFNPVSWLLKRAVKENLEFSVDRQMLQTGFDARNYQYMLVRIGGLRATLATNFTELTIKKRIGMMNRKPSSRRLMASYSLLLMILVTLSLPKIPGASVNRERGITTDAGNFSIDPKNAFAVIDTPNGTLNLIRNIQLKHRKAGSEPPTELILFSKNSEGRGMDVYVKIKDDQIEQIKILALASPHFSANNFSKKPLASLK
ncbi:M56 family metallopeptidase [Larkinella humicola]|uniref:M56 family metallopeptidase n=1 Tax=Larkinella humicola TaxID=2607654 RepID=A0A5N1JMC3_9BACT|nr:M56 family metallopeptidase [Larkinella humicola]KAA9355133.1 M56 family metallopeptidase [Larkinella humicola]